jgi:hypothetical protein
LSCGALLDNFDLVELARRHGGRILVPTGALIGLDAVQAAALGGGIRSVQMITRKPPGGLEGAPYLVEHQIRVSGLTQAKLVFTGSAREAARGFPANVNVAAALALAGIGPDRTTIEIWADPAVDRNIHRIEVEADAARFSMQIENVPSLENPRTGRLTPLSVIALLRKLTSPSRSEPEPCSIAEWTEPSSTPPTTTRRRVPERDAIIAGWAARSATSCGVSIRRASRPRLRRQPARAARPVPRRRPEGADARLYPWRLLADERQGGLRLSRRRRVAPHGINLRAHRIHAGAGGPARPHRRRGAPRGWLARRASGRLRRRPGAALCLRPFGRRPPDRDDDDAARGSRRPRDQRLYDLEPIRLNYLNEKLGLDVAEAERNSPLLHLPPMAGRTRRRLWHTRTARALPPVDRLRPGLGESGASPATCCQSTAPTISPSSKRSPAQMAR